jgi:hypothetical protein
MTRILLQQVLEPFLNHPTQPDLSQPMELPLRLVSQNPASIVYQLSPQPVCPPPTFFSYQP